MSAHRPPAVLDSLVSAARRSMEERRRDVPLVALEREAARREARGAAFMTAVAGGGRHVEAGASASANGRPAIVAECKRCSPSRGLLREAYDPAEIALCYERAGAAAVSVLTEEAHFGGSLAHLAAARAATSLPLLRKDFVVDEYQVVEARAAGADAVLLIAAALEPSRLRSLLAFANSLGLAALVEAHDELELDAALEAGATLVGVNNRDLRTLQVDIGTSLRLAAKLPAGVVTVAESGIRSRRDVERLQAAGYAAFLVGEQLMTAPDPGAALGELIVRGEQPAAVMTR